MKFKFTPTIFILSALILTGCSNDGEKKETIDESKPESYNQEDGSVKVNQATEEKPYKQEEIDFEEDEFYEETDEIETQVEVNSVGKTSEDLNNIAINTISVISKLYSKDSNFRDESFMYNYLKENFKVSEEVIEDNLIPYYKDMNDYEEYGEIKHEIISVEKVGENEVVLEFILDVTFYDKPSNEQVEYFRETYKVNLENLNGNYFIVNIQSFQR